MLENVMAACHSIFVPAHILEHPNKIPAVHGGYNTYRFRRSQHYTHRGSVGELRFIKVDVPDEVSRQSVDEAQLPTDWSRRITVTRAWGDRWLSLDSRLSGRA